MKKKTELIKFLASLTMCVENGQELFDEIIESENKVLDAAYQVTENIICKKWMHNQKVQQKHLNKLYQKKAKEKKAKEKKALRARYDYFIDASKAIIQDLKATDDDNKEVLDNVCGYMRDYLKNIKLS